MTRNRYVIEEFDGFTPADPVAARHLTFVREQDAIARRYGMRSYLLPDGCPACGRLVAELERTQTQTPTGDPR